MIAGLPNNIRKATLFVLVLSILLVFALPGLAEDVQTPSTTLDDVLTLVTQNGYLSPTQQTLLTSSLTSAITSGALTPDETHRDSWRLGRESTESYCVAVTREFVREYGSFAYPKFPNYRVVLQKSLDRQRTGEWNLIAQRVLGFFHTLVEMEA